MILSFPIESNRSRNPFVTLERLLNLYVEYTPRGKDTGPLFRAPGTVRVNSTPLGAGPCRGAFGWQDVGYIVVGDTLYQFTPSASGFVIQSRGTLNSSTGRVTFAADLDEIVLVDGLDGYVYNVDSGVFSTINDPDFQGGTHVAQLNGFTITNRPTSDVWQISSPQTPLDWDALDIAVGEANGDNIQALTDHEERVWLLGSHVTEVWVPSTTDFPFSRQAVIPVGCGAPYSLAKADNSLIWVDWEGFVRRSVGYRALIISNQGLSDAIADMSTFRDAFAYTYSERNHQFYVLTFPTANQTWAYDFATQKWAERAFWNPSSQTFTRHHSNCHMYAGGKNLVGDYRDGRVYELTSEVTSDDQQMQRWEMVTPIVVDPQAPTRPLKFFDLVLDMQTGVGTQQVGQPKVLMSYSDDGGHTWSDESTRAFDLGQGLSGYSKNIKWTRLGRCKGKGRMFRFRGHEDVATSLITAESRVA